MSDQALYDNTTLLWSNRAYCDCTWLAANAETMKSRHIAKQLCRILTKIFKKACKHRSSSKLNDEAWHLSTLLMKDETLHPDANCLLMKAKIQQSINMFAEKIEVTKQQSVLESF